MARISRKELKKDEFVEAAFDVRDWLKRYWRSVLKAVVPVVVVGLIVLAWFWNAQRIEREAQELLAQGTYRFRQAEADAFIDFDLLGEALTLFEQAAERGGSSPAGKVARYYQGVALYRLGRLEEAIATLDTLQLDAGDSPSLGAAKSLLADLLVESGQADLAINMLSQLAEEPDSTYPPDLALLQLGRIHKAQGNLEEARRSWSRVVDEYPQSLAAQQASRLLGS